ncbi:Polysaccharide deacetylase [Caballeronia fortuita]|uniref:Polysaccharide deacetylase n=1 Tax=Caballeronia fortuita TaxID=1777138 RepID=A0A158ANM7_9BURK|nr:polysaccharide deacetylase family protein [Caballeronia fortuita]SAK59518.1 Polysaccharide deacetylase [Caballeronia fortuita]
MSYFLISLDFELMWGVRDHRTVATYGKNILGVREAIPAMLAMFTKHRVKATWATVGMLLFDNKKDLLANLPDVRPTYTDAKLSPYTNGYLDSIGDSEKSDPYHYGLSLARQIVDTEGSELASHTFCHYYALEKGQDKAQFAADMAASVASIRRLADPPASIVFPRNQVNNAYLPVCAEQGLIAYRGTERNWMYRETARADEAALRRAARLADAYVNLSGDHAFEPRASSRGLVDVRSSRFLRPYAHNKRALEWLRIHRIKQSMTSAARTGRSFHLWWHPHNFGANLAENIAVLEAVLKHHVYLRETYGMQPATMAEVARATQSQETGLAEMEFGLSV